MAPLPANNSSRLFIDYTSLNTQHTVACRYEGIQTTPNLIAAFNEIADVLSGIMVSSDSVLAARYQNAGTNFSIELPVTPVPGANGLAGNLWVEDPDSAQISLVGRDNVSGRRVRWLFFTPYNFAATWPTDNRYNPGENPSIDNFITNWSSLAGGGGAMPFPLVSIANNPVVVYDYANICKNGYWERTQRG